MRSFALSIFLALIVSVCANAAPSKWVENSFEDFADGVLDSSGQNLYVTRSGRITSINRFDLNSDGRQDLVFNSAHDFVTAPKPTVYTLPSKRAIGKATDLPVFGTTLGTTADLNKDGLLDLVVCPNNDWVSSHARRYAFVFWGGKDGWSHERMTNLLTIRSLAVQSGDIDGDGWQDLIFLNGCRWAPEDGPECVLRIYWGSNEGFRQEAYKDLVLGNATDLAVSDMDGDGRPDIVILQSPIDVKPTTDPEVLIYWNDGIKRDTGLTSPVKITLGTDCVGKLRLADLNKDNRADLIVSGVTKDVISRNPTTGADTYRYSGLLSLVSNGNRAFDEPITSQSPQTSAMAIVDFNNDGQPDIALADSTAKKNSVTILPGKTDSGFDAGKMTKLAIGRASALSAADLDSDGNQDLVVGVYQTDDTFQADSRVFYGDGRGGFNIADDKIPTSAVNNVFIAPTDSGDGHRLVFCNNIWGRINEDVPVYVYWGVKGGFDTKKLSKYHIRSGYASCAADINDDGFPDLVLGSIVHMVSDAHPERGFNILWGGKDGLVDERRTIVQEYALWTSSIADLNKDGYLDLIGSCNAVNEKGEPTRIVVWYGAKAGFDPSRRVMLPCEGVQGPNVVADYNNDGWLDIAVTRPIAANRVSIFWGSSSGFSKDREFSIPLPSPNDACTADLNRDGWLDLIVSCMGVPGTMHYDLGTYIFWGGPQGFRQSNAQRLRGSFAVGISVADYDNDGYLDINLPNYKWSDLRESLQSFLYWGGPDGYSDHNKTTLLVDSGHGTQSADFNGDGLIDIAMSCHSLDGDHWTNSRVYYNDGNRFKEPKVQLLPTCGPHYMTHADVGNQYDRSYNQTYVSSVYKWQNISSRGKLTFKAQIAGKCRLTFSVRSAEDNETLETKPWLTLKGSDFKLNTQDRYLQYRAVFTSDNGDRYPVLDQVEVSLSH